MATLASFVFAAFAFVLPGDALSYESDVHFGLTRWLALQAGFTESQANSIAMADQRIDGGMIETLTLDMEFACAGRFPQVALQAQQAHAPSATPVPAPAADRTVVPGSDAARAALAALAPRLKGKEGLMLGKFGEALHPLQDSWAHRGVPSELRLGESLRCDPALVSAHAVARGGPASHGADITARWPADALAMAHATYDALVAYPAIGGQPRQAAAWDSLPPLLTGFVKATTKTQKRAWFVAQGMPDTRFLGGISLPDGHDPGPLDWNGRKLLALPGNASMQHDAPADVRAFVDRLLARWLGAERVDVVVAEMGGGGPSKPLSSSKSSSTGKALPTGTSSPSARELTALLTLWKVRDHGSVADLVHAPSPMTAAQLRAAERLTSDPRALLAPTDVSQAVYPLQPSTPAPMPLLPYILRTLPDVDGASRWVAIVKLRHAPYDTIGWVIERRANVDWTLVEVVASVGP